MPSSMNWLELFNSHLTGEPLEKSILVSIWFPKRIRYNTAGWDLWDDGGWWWPFLTAQAKRVLTRPASPSCCRRPNVGVQGQSLGPFGERWDHNGGIKLARTAGTRMTRPGPVLLGWLSFFFLNQSCYKQADILSELIWINMFVKLIWYHQTTQS